MSNSITESDQNATGTEPNSSSNEANNSTKDCVAGIVATTSASSTVAVKEKRGWFHSLTRRKKTPTQAAPATATITTAPVAEEELFSLNLSMQNNNNEPPLPSLAQSTAEDCSTSTGTRRKRKEEKNAFQKFRKKIGLHFYMLRHRRHENGDNNTSGTTDASAEFLTHSPAHEPTMRPIHEQLRFSFTDEGTGREIAALEEIESEMVPFTHDYKRFIVKKWLDIESPNRVMYRACSEMLSQVWYWGEISRRDAQKQLTDKPTGSFLVRDSETSGCQFTLSFRILNVTLHYRLVYHDNYWHFEELQYESVVELIEDILYRCTNNNFVCFVRVPNEVQPPFPVILKYPLSRYLKMPHLQDLCRRVIQRYATPEEIAQLPLPPKMHEYLNEKRELVFQT